MITFLLFGVAVLASSALYVVATRGSAVHTALAADNTVIGLRDCATDTLPGGMMRPSSRASDWQMTSVDDLSAAEDLLDCLEANGVADKELVVMGNKCFAVRWR